MARNHALKYALIVSALIHLSMVSVFSIMIWFPRKDLQYFNVEIVPQSPAPVQAAGAVASPAPLGALRLPDSGDLLGAGDPVTDTDPQSLADASEWAGLPPINLPRVEFADLERLRSREESLRIRSKFSELFESRPRDSWAIFSDELRGLGRRLRSGLAGGDDPVPERRPVRVSTPAPGFGMYVQWMSPPYDRQLLFSPPVQALWEVDAIDVAQPIVLVFSVNPQGKVVEIQIPVEDEAGLVSSIGNALLKYRFAPLSGDQNQRATFLLAPDQDAGYRGGEVGLP